MANQPMPKIGVDYFHYSPVIYDSPEGSVYASAVRVTGQTAASYAPNSASNPFYADNGTYVSDTSLANQEVSLTLADVPPNIFSDMIGGDYNGALSIGSSFAAKERGVLYRIKMSGGAYRYMRFWKGTFTLPEIAAATQGESIEYQTSELMYSAITAQGKEYFVQMVDDDDPNVLDMGITPEILEEKIVDFNWDPFTGNPAFKGTVKLAVAPAGHKAQSGGAVNKPIFLGLTGATFKREISVTDITANNLPAGLSIGSVEFLGDPAVKVILNGSATNHTEADSVDNISFTVDPAGLEEVAAALTSPNFSVKFVD